MYTPFFLQDVLIQEINEIFQEDRFPSRNGSEEKINVVKQFLPITQPGRTEEEQEDLENGLLDDITGVDGIQFPYIIVNLLSGKISTKNEPGSINILLYIGVCDERNDRSGYLWLLNIIQRLSERFQKDSTIENYRCGEEILWEVSEQDDHPYYFGAMSMEFQAAAIVKEDRYC